MIPTCTLYLLLFLSPLLGVSSTHYTVLRIIDGDSIVINCPSGRNNIPVAVRLQFINTPEMRVDNKDNPAGLQAKKQLEQYIQIGDRVRLWTQEKTFQSDPHGRCLAIVFPYKSKVSLQAAMISAGFSPYWRRYGETVKELHQDWLLREQRSQTQGLGLWNSDTQWMLARQAERQWGK